MDISNQDIKKQRIYRTVISIFSTVAGLTSSVVIYILVCKIIPNHWPKYVETPLASIITLSLVSCIEFIPRAVLPSTLDAYYLAKKKGTWGKIAILKNEIILTFFICFTLYGVSITTSILSKDKIAEAAVQEPETINIAAYIIQQDSLDRKAMEDRAAQKKEAMNFVERMDEKAKAEEQKLLENALNSKGKEMRRLIEKGNDWANGKVLSEKNEANKKSFEFKQQLNGLASEMMKTEEIGLSANEKLKLIQESNEKELLKYESEKAKYEGYAIWVGVLSTCFCVLIMILASLHRVAKNITLEKNHTAPNIIYSFLSMLDKGSDKWSKKMYDKGLKDHAYLLDEEEGENQQRTGSNFTGNSYDNYPVNEHGETVYNQNNSRTPIGYLRHEIPSSNPPEISRKKPLQISSKNSQNSPPTYTKTNIGFKGQISPNFPPSSQNNKGKKTGDNEGGKSPYMKGENPPTIKGDNKGEKTGDSTSEQNIYILKLMPETPYNLGKKYNLGRSEKKQINEVRKAYLKFVEDHQKRPLLMELVRVVNKDKKTVRKYVDMMQEGIESPLLRSRGDRA